MATRYAVVAMEEDVPFVFGLFRSEDRADAFAAKINAAVDVEEQRRIAAWRANPERYDGEVMPHISSVAYVRIVRTPRVRQAIDLVLGRT